MQENNVFGQAFPRAVRTLLLPLLMVAVVPFRVHAQEISIRGSDTLIYLGQRFAAMYARQSSQAQIVVRGGGVPASVEALRSGEATIAQFEGESAPAISPDFVSFPVGLQTIVVYVNSENPVHELTISQLRSIFMGEITNWKMLGGPDSTILLYAGESTTGTLAYFQESILRGEEPYPFVGKANTKSLLDEIASHPEAIGYGGLAQQEGTRAIAIKFGPTSLAIPPTEETIRSRQYPITRHVSWIVRRRRSPVLDALCDWTLSAEGQLVVEAAGFEPLLPRDRTAVLAKMRESETAAR